MNDPIQTGFTYTLGDRPVRWTDEDVMWLASGRAGMYPTTSDVALARRLATYVGANGDDEPLCDEWYGPRLVENGVYVVQPGFTARVGRLALHREEDHTWTAIVHPDEREAETHMVEGREELDRLDAQAPGELPADERCRWCYTLHERVPEDLCGHARIAYDQASQLLALLHQARPGAHRG